MVDPYGSREHARKEEAPAEVGDTGESTCERDINGSYIHIVAGSTTAIST